MLHMSSIMMDILPKNVFCPSMLLHAEENQRLLLDCPGTSEQIVRLLGSESSAVRKECLALVYMYSGSQHGRRMVTEKLDLYR